MLSAAEFRDRVVACGIISPIRLDEILGKLSQNGPPPSAEQYANRLIDEDVLTAWQARQIVAGRGKYMLLESRYGLLDKLGQGGMAAVFRARDLKLGRQVVVKIPKPSVLERPSMLARFRKEVLANGRLEHPNIVRALDVGNDGKLHFIILELVDGENLHHLVRRKGPLPVEQALDYVRQVSEALEYASRQGVVHRDLKPSNMLVTADHHVKVLDMGLARLFSTDAIPGGDESVETVFTKAGTLVGTANYIAPEQAQNVHRADTRSDIYSLGCSLYELLAGQSPFRGRTPMETVVMHMTESAPRVKGAGREVQRLLDRMMAKEPDDRHASPTELLSDLRRCLRKVSGRKKARVTTQGIAAMTESIDDQQGKTGDPSLHLPADLPDWLAQDDAPRTRRRVPTPKAKILPDEFQGSPNGETKVCIPITPLSHRMAFADLINARRLADLIELGLDRFVRTPNIPSLLEVCQKPAIASCRRLQDGGRWSGTEVERLEILRRAIRDGVGYVELELDCAEHIAREGSTLRVISYTNTAGIPPNLREIHARASRLDADVVKLVLPIRTPHDAALVASIVQSSRVPTTVVGLGPSGPAAVLLGRRFRSPWTYTSLSRQTEGYPGAGSFFDLEDFYDARRVTTDTPFLVVSGEGERTLLTVRLLNDGFRQAGSRVRCLPLRIDRASELAQVASPLGLVGVVMEGETSTSLNSLLERRSRLVRAVGSADMLFLTERGWMGEHSFAKAAIDVIERVLPGDRSKWADRHVVFVGLSPPIRAMAFALLTEKARVTLIDRDRHRARRVATQLRAQSCTIGELPPGDCDVLVVNVQAGSELYADLTPEVLAEEGALLDLGKFPRTGDLANRAREQRAAQVADPIDVQLNRVQRILRRTTKCDVGIDDLGKALEGYDLEAMGSPLG
ncbi:Serine/threonine-protein kinase PknB [Planctomycetes bacterium Pan216]|uniref:Serine/threonine-protein kinase PknB n=1 Tax=Kolteria novifilia TaxID=2527975 RepID=A0A518BAU2_9BACT|nr:Serine/threonine-protein kinase PknB [Planctomycetes bacterium Pan216]